MTIKIRLPKLEGNNTRLANRVSAGATSISVENGNGFSSGQRIVVGNSGEETSEIVVVSSATDTTITISALKYGHSAGDLVAYSVFDKYSIEHKTSSTASWTEFGSMPKDLRWDQEINTYRPDPTITVYSARVRLYSTELGAYSNYSDEILSTGFERQTVKKMTDQILRKMKDSTIDRVYILQLLNEAQDIILAENENWSFLLTRDDSSITTAAGQTEYDLPDDYDRMHSVYLRYVKSSTDVTYELEYLPMKEFLYYEQDNNASAEDRITYYTITPDSKLLIHEPENGGLSIIIYYYKKADDLDSDGDKSDIPLAPALKYYVLSILENDRGNESKSLTYFRLYKKMLGNLTTRERPPISPSRRLRYKPSFRIGTEGRRTRTQKDKENYW